MTRLTAADLRPFYQNTIGVDRLFDRILNNIEAPQNNYPPYNVIQIDDDSYLIEIAVAGFGMEDLEILLDANTLTITGTTPAQSEEVKFLHRGIAGRNFRREFTLADHMEVNSAGLENGMLNILLKREVPEAMKPKTIAINHQS